MNLSAGQRAEIAAHFHAERDGDLAARLGVPRRLVKAEIRVIRARSADPARSSGAGVRTVLLPLLLGSIVLGAGAHVRAHRPTPFVAPPRPEAGAESRAANSLYARLDRRCRPHRNV